MEENRIVTDKYNYIDACNKIRELTGKDKMYYPNQLEDGIHEVYDAGFAAGGGGGGGPTLEDWWKGFTNNYTRTLYRYAFYGEGWNDITFNPPQTIYPSDARYMFQSSSVKQVLASQVNFSRCSEMRDLFNGCTKLERIEDLDISHITNSSTMLAGCTNIKYLSLIVSDTTKISTNITANGTKIEEVVWKGNITDTNTSYFFSNPGTSMKELTIDGTIKATVGFRYNTSLSAESIKSILDACNGDGTGITVTLPYYCGGNYTNTEELCGGSTCLEAYLAAQGNGYTFTFT